MPVVLECARGILRTGLAVPRQRGFGAATREVIQGNDRPEALVDGGSIFSRTLEAMERAGLRAARLDSQPWSDDYWPMYKGMLGARYSDGAALGPLFADNFAYVQAFILPLISWRATMAARSTGFLLPKSMSS